MTTVSSARHALIVIDLQQGFDDPVWGHRNNPECETNVRALVDGFRESGDPIVLVRHDSVTPGSPLRPDRPGNAFKPILADVEPALVVAKNVHSAFGGDVDLDAWLRERGIGSLVICGIQTNRCCETTARVAGDAGYEVQFALDATHTFDEAAPDGERIEADVLSRVTAVNLHGHFGDVVTTKVALERLAAA